MSRKTPGPPCAICGTESVAKKLCAKHYKRMQRHGHADTSTRPEDWGQRDKHPMIESWRWAKRVGLAPEWRDFWKFVSDVGARPTEKHLLRRRDQAKDFGPSNWYWSEPIADSGIGDSSRAARASYAKSWRAKNPLLTKNSELKKKFGIDIAEYEEILNAQNGGCAICGQKDEWFRLAVDHCHGTKKIRGLLCSQCNRGLGLFKDNPDLLERGAEYLRWPKRLL